jgi:hypothetical protein
MQDRCKVESGSSNLIVTFNSDANHRPEWKRGSKFEWKSSLVDNTRMTINSDFLFLRDSKRRWYLDGICGTSKDLNETVYFLKKECETYENVIFMGSSAGGYASILFGSLVEPGNVLAFTPQTDLKFARWSLPTRAKRGIPHKELAKYWNLRGVINQNVKYHVTCEDDDTNLLHAFHHYRNISDFSNVHRLHPTNPGEMLKCGELEKFLVSHLI